MYHYVDSENTGSILVCYTGERITPLVTNMGVITCLTYDMHYFLLQVENFDIKVKEAQHYTTVAHKGTLWW